MAVQAAEVSLVVLLPPKRPRTTSPSVTSAKVNEQNQSKTCLSKSYGSLRTGQSATSDCAVLPYESTIVNSDKAGQGSDQDAAIMIAGNAENDHVSCDSTVKGSMTTLTEGSTHQTSLDLFTVVAPGGGNKPKGKSCCKSRWR